MTFGQIFEQRRIIKAKVRFSNDTDAKIRPIVIISNHKFNNTHNDVICCPITSEIRGRGIEINNDKLYLEKGRIPKKSEIKSQYPLIIDKKLCERPESEVMISKNIANQIITDIKEILIVS